MKRVLTVAVAGVALAVVGVAVAAQNWSVRLTGDQEVPARATEAHGQASFHLSKDGTELRYKLNVANIENVVMAHIHCGAPADNGPPAVWLYPSTTPGAGPSAGGAVQGRIASGTITAGDIVHVCAGGLAGLVARMNNGTAYVNVHTDDGVAPLNTGPGDFLAGEIRANLP